MGTMRETAMIIVRGCCGETIHPMKYVMSKYVDWIQHDRHGVSLITAVGVAIVE